MTRAEWLALAERCEAATGPDTELDAAIACAVYGWTQISEEIDPYGDVPMLIDRDGSGPMIPGEYTASIDAIAALIGREFPGWIGSLLLGPCTFASIGHAGLNCGGYKTATADTPALALCAAFCRAKAERVEAEQAGIDHTTIALYTLCDKQASMLAAAEARVKALEEALEEALADAIRRPMGVIPASAEGLVSTAALDAAETRRARAASEGKP